MNYPRLYFKGVFFTTSGFGIKLLLSSRFDEVLPCSHLSFCSILRSNCGRWVNSPVGNDWLAIVPHDDERITKAIKTGPYTKALVSKFKDQFGRKIYPSFLIFADNIPDKLRAIEAIVGFRNSFALSVIIKGHEHSLTSTFVAYPLYSDYFDFYPITVTKANDGFLTSSPSVLGYDNEHKKFAGQSSPSLAGMSSVSVGLDDRLFGQLLRIWERRFLKGRTSEWATRSLFRSLEMAYKASAMPFQNHASIYDYGSSASLWVSAFEILSHPRTNNANLLTVIDLLGKYKWNEKLINPKSAFKKDMSVELSLSRHFMN